MKKLMQKIFMVVPSNLYATRKELNEHNLFGMPLLPLEYGHVIQSRIWGMFYLPLDRKSVV